MNLDKQPSYNDILVIGNSHTRAIANALGSNTYSMIDVVNLASFFDPVNRKNKILYPEIADLFHPKHIFCTFGGSEHTVFGVLENPVKFDFMTRTCHKTKPNREIILHGLVHATLQHAMRGAYRHMRELCDFFDCPVTHICSPPPFKDINDTVILPRVFQENLHLGINPPSIRKKMHEVHSNIAQEFSASLNIEFLGVPLDSTDSEGFLHDHLWTKDPTHGNANYGAMVIEQILEVANV